MLKVCRFCLCNDGASLMLLTDSIDAEHTIQDVVEYTGIQIDVNQLDSYFVCLECSTTLNTFAIFRINCLTNDPVFREQWVVATVQKTQEKNVESIKPSISAEGTMDFFKDHPVDEEENSSQIGSVANSVCQEIPIVDECIQNSPQNIFCVANISTKALKTTEGNGEDDFYSANYISPREQSYTDNVYFGDSFVDWSCYYWPPQREPKRCQREPGKRKYHLCDVCGIMVGHMPTHALVHKPQPTYACPYCSVKMKQKSGMVQHIQTVHLKVVSKTCHLCGKTFVHRKTYVYHMRAHKDAGESFECKVCSKTFFRSIGLEVHVRKVHSIAKSV